MCKFGCSFTLLHLLSFAKHLKFIVGTSVTALHPGTVLLSKVYFEITVETVRQVKLIPKVNTRENSPKIIRYFYVTALTVVIGNNNKLVDCYFIVL